MNQEEHFIIGKMLKIKFQSDEKCLFNIQYGFKIIILLVMTGWVFPSSSIVAANIDVCKSCDIKTIKGGIEAAQDGDVVKVQKGVYQEFEIAVDKPITLLAEPGVVIDGQNQGEILTLEADGIIVDGFEIINVGSSYLKDFAAVRAKRIKDFVIQNLTVRKPFFAIFIEKSSHGKVLNNKIYGEAVNEFNAANGIHVWYSKHMEIKGNEIYQMRDGIYLEFTDYSVMDNNLSKDNIRYGLHFMFSQDNTVSNSSYINNGAGIAIMFSKNMDMFNNVFRDNWGGTAYGVLLKEAIDSTIKNNVFERNTTGINIEGSNRIVFENNDFQSNGWAINSRGANYRNKFTKNNFLDNSFDLAYNGPMNQNTFNGNYWSEYSGYDLDRDGVGDVPHRPVKLFSYLVNKSPEAIILLRSVFIDLVDFAEKVSPVFTPGDLMDETPSIKMIIHD